MCKRRPLHKQYFYRSEIRPDLSAYLVYHRCYHGFRSQLYNPLCLGLATLHFHWCTQKYSLQTNIRTSVHRAAHTQADDSSNNIFTVIRRLLNDGGSTVLYTVLYTTFKAGCVLLRRCVQSSCPSWRFFWLQQICCRSHIAAIAGTITPESPFTISGLSGVKRPASNVQ